MKKLVSRFMAVLMAMTMILSMSMTVFAAEAPKGTLTVNNTVKGKTLDLYQIFTATKSEENVAYTLNSAYEGFFKIKVENGSSLSGEALSEAAYDYVKKQVGPDGSNGAAFAKDIMGWILGNTATVEGTHTTAITADTTTVINNLDYGYYVVYPLGATDTSTAPGNETVKSVASLVSVTGTDATVNMKSNYPTVVKKVNDKNADDVNIGDTVTYTLTSKVPDMTGYTSYVFNFKDTLAKGLTFGSITSVTVGSGESVQDVTEGIGNDTYTLTKNNTTDGTTEIKIEMNNFLASNKDKVGRTITVTYTATLNKDAVTGFDPNTNKATVEYSNKPGTEGKGESEPSIVDVHTFNFTIYKYYKTTIGEEETKNLLAGAEFELYKANAAGDAADTDAKINIVDEGNGVYRQATADEAKAADFTSAKIVSDTDGKVLVKGLDAGTYYLRETKAPDGYNKLLSDIKVEIKADYDPVTDKLTNYTVTYTYNNVTNSSTSNNAETSPEVPVENKTGAQLPSTGSKGALMVTLAGIVLFGALTASKAFGKKKAKN